MICRVCDSGNLEPVIDLGIQPWGNHFLRPEEVGSEPRYPLRVVFCHACATAQLDYTVPKEVMFGDHTYLSGVTKSLTAHFRGIAEEVQSRFHQEMSLPRALDIGSNDGTQLKHFEALGYEVLGVEASKTTARLAQEAGVPTLNVFFNEDVAKTLGSFDVINAAGVFFHLEELHSVAEGIHHCLRRDGVFVVQFLYMKRILENRAFDQIYHEHLLYYNLETLAVLLARHGLELFDAYLAPIHGGSIVAFVGHPGKRPATARLNSLREHERQAGSNSIETYTRFAVAIEQKKTENVGYLQRARGDGKRVFGFGAPVKGNTLLNYFGIGRELVECLVEKNPLRAGLISPGMHIPIVMESEIATPPDVYYVLAWNYRDEILANNKPLLDAGVEFYFPVVPC